MMLVQATECLGGGEEDGRAAELALQRPLDLLAPMRVGDVLAGPAEPLHRVARLTHPLQRRNEAAGRLADLVLTDGNGEAVGNVDDRLTHVARANLHAPN